MPVVTKNAKGFYMELISKQKVLADYGEILTVEDVCNILHVGRKTIYGLLNSNTIENFKIGNTRRIPKQCLLNYINNMINGI